MFRYPASSVHDVDQRTASKASQSEYQHSFLSQDVTKANLLQFYFRYYLQSQEVTNSNSCFNSKARLMSFPDRSNYQDRIPRDNIKSSQPAIPEVYLIDGLVIAAGAFVLGVCAKSPHQSDLPPRTTQGKCCPCRLDRWGPTLGRNMACLKKLLRPVARRSTPWCWPSAFPQRHAKLTEALSIAFRRHLLIAWPIFPMKRSEAQCSSYFRGNCLILPCKLPRNQH